MSELLVRRSKSTSHRWKVLATGVAANASFAAVFQGVPTAAVAIRSDYQLTDAQLGLALGVIGLGMAISEIPWGLLTDRIGDRRVLQVGLGLTVAGLAFLASPLGSPVGEAVPNPMVLYSLLFVVGVFGGCVNGASGKAIMAWFSNAERGLAMSIRQTAIPLGGGLGALINLRLADSFGFAWMYGVLGLLCAISWVAAWLWIYDPKPSDSHATPASDDPTEVADSTPLRSGATWLIVSAIGLLCAPQFAIITFGSVFFHDYVDVSAFLGVLVLVVIQIGAIVLRVWSGRWTDVHGNRRQYLKVCGYGSGIAFVILAAISPLGGFGVAGVAAVFVTYLVAGLVVSAWHGVAFAELVTVVGHRFAGTALGMANTVVFASLFLTPLTIPYLLRVGRWPVVWATLGILSVVATLMFPRAARPVAPER